MWRCAQRQRRPTGKRPEAAAEAASDAVTRCSLTTALLSLTPPTSGALSRRIEESIQLAQADESASAMPTLLAASG